MASFKSYIPNFVEGCNNNDDRLNNLLNGDGDFHLNSQSLNKSYSDGQKLGDNSKIDLRINRKSEPIVNIHNRLKLESDQMHFNIKLPDGNKTFCQNTIYSSILTHSLAYTFKSSNPMSSNHYFNDLSLVYTNSSSSTSSTKSKFKHNSKPVYHNMATEYKICSNSNSSDNSDMYLNKMSNINDNKNSKDCHIVEAYVDFSDFYSLINILNFSNKTKERSLKEITDPNLLPYSSNYSSSLSDSNSSLSNSHIISDSDKSLSKFSQSIINQTDTNECIDVNTSIQSIYPNNSLCLKAEEKISKKLKSNKEKDEVVKDDLYHKLKALKNAVYSSLF
ncbi:unnamed protein product [Gordionus sp. m RMFG-2023]